MGQQEGVHFGLSWRDYWPWQRLEVSLSVLQKWRRQESDKCSRVAPLICISPLVYSLCGWIITCRSFFDLLHFFPGVLWNPRLLPGGVFGPVDRSGCGDMLEENLSFNGRYLYFYGRIVRRVRDMFCSHDTWYHIWWKVSATGFRWLPFIWWHTTSSSWPGDFSTCSPPSTLFSHGSAATTPGTQVKDSNIL